MEVAGAPTPIWEEIDRAESYLVSGMFDEATSLALSNLKQLLRKQGKMYEKYEYEWGDMVESAGMVLIQSLKQLGRAPEIMNELKLLFGSVTDIPVQVFLTGICLQISESPSTAVRGYLEEFLNNWRYVNGQYYPLSVSEASISDTETSCIRCEVDTYLEVVELYVVTLLAMSIKDIDLAISWVEQAMLPMEKRQELLRRLHSMNSSKVTSSSQSSLSHRLQDEYVEKSDALRKQKPYNHDQAQSGSIPNGAHTAKKEILKLSRRSVPCISWFPAINLKFGKTRLLIPSGRLLLVSLLLLVYYLTRKKHTALKRVLIEKTRLMKNAVLDLWQLAFSYQVNPLAAVQPLPSTARGGP